MLITAPIWCCTWDLWDWFLSHGLGHKRSVKNLWGLSLVMATTRLWIPNCHPLPNCSLSFAYLLIRERPWIAVIAFSDCYYVDLSCFICGLLFTWVIIPAFNLSFKSLTKNLNACVYMKGRKKIKFLSHPTVKGHLRRILFGRFLRQNINDKHSNNLPSLRSLLTPRKPKENAPSVVQITAFMC